MAINKTIKIALFTAGTFGLAFSVLPIAFAVSNINNDVKKHNAWNDVIGWIDFGNGSVNVTNTNLTGYADSQVGSVGLDCATTPNGDICSGPAGQWGVSNTFTAGNFANLAGWAWNDQIGWISLCGNLLDGGSVPSPSGDKWVCPNFPTYQVRIKVTGSAAGDFAGWAWNDAIGWISFNCDHTDVGDPYGISNCGTSDYKVNTSWTPSNPPAPSGDLTSSVFDTCQSGINCGAGFNTIRWRGDPNGGGVRFQIASSDTKDGSWNFYGPNGNDANYYAALPDISYKITKEHNNKRYIKYKIYLDICPSNCEQIITPVVDDVIINWSP